MWRPVTNVASCRDGPWQQERALLDGGTVGYASLVNLDALLFLVAVTAILARALFVAADAALAGVSAGWAEQRRNMRPGWENAALLALKIDPEGTSATIRCGSILSLASAASLAGAACFRLLGPALGDSPLGAVVSTGIGGAGAAAVILLTDLIPRSVAVANPEAWAERLAIPLWIAWRAFSPAARALLRVVGIVLRPIGVRATFLSAPPALEDLERWLVDGARADSNGPAPEWVESFFEFSSLTAREVMVPRTEVVAVPLGIDPNDLVHLVAEKGHTRMPVYEGEIDHVVGIVYTRDLVPLLAHPELIKLPDVIRPVRFVPWATRIGKLLREMQKERIHLAMVTDEHGGVMGLITLDDILEEIVGELPDDREGALRPLFEVMPDGSYRVETSIDIYDFNDAIGISLPDDGDFDTLAGFLNHLAGEIPDAGRVLESHGLIFTIEERSPRRVLVVRVRAAAA